MFRYISAAFSAAILVMPLYGGNYEVKSPDGRLKAEVSVGERIGYTVSCGDDIILRSSEIGMILRDRSLGQDAVLKSTERESVEFRAFNDGIAYRFITDLKGNIEVLDERFSLDFLDSGRSYAMTSFSDGPNSGRQAMDYRMKKTQVDSGSVLDIRMARNRGWTAVLE